MKSSKKVWISLIVWVIAGLSITNISVASAGDDETVAKAVAQFYVALNTMFTGDVTPMKDVWSHQDDVTYMGPVGGMQVGWDQVEEYWQGQAALKLGGHVSPADMQVTIGQTLAVTSNFENGENTNAKGETQKISIRATNTFRKENGEWKMIGHHTDLLPYLVK